MRSMRSELATSPFGMPSHVSINLKFSITDRDFKLSRVWCLVIYLVMHAVHLMICINQNKLELQVYRTTKPGEYVT